MTIKCEGCGKFVATDEMKDGRAKFHFLPESEFGHEISEWTCERCVWHDVELAKLLAAK